MTNRGFEWFGGHFVADSSFHASTANPWLDHHLLGNGLIQAVIQVTRQPTGRNALAIHLMNPDRFEGRPKTSSFTYHAQLGPEYTLVGLVTHDGIFLPQPRQAGVDFQYGLDFESEPYPRFVASYKADFALSGARRKTPFSVTENLWIPEGVAALIRSVTVTNRRGLEPAAAHLLVTLTPNQELFPMAHYRTDESVAVAGDFDSGDEFLGLKVDHPDVQRVQHMVSTFPKPLAAIAEDNFGQGSHDDGDFVRPQTGLRNYPVLPGSGQLGPQLAFLAPLGDLAPDESATVDIFYVYGPSEQDVVEAASHLATDAEEVEKRTARLWEGYNEVNFGDDRMSQLYLKARSGLHASVARSGRMNAGIWGYNAEWVRDSSLACVGVILSGQFGTARSMLEGILERLIDATGMAFGEARFYSADEAELDQNGELLYAVWLYWTTSRDDSLLRSHWDLLHKVAEFPLGGDYWVEAAHMVKSTRDIRERDKSRHGFLPGFDLGHQMWVHIGLAKAADLADVVGDEAAGHRWRTKADELWRAVMHDPTYSFIENDYLMSRRLLDGSFQRTAKPSPYVHRPGSGLDTRIYPRNVFRASELEPSSFEAWPVAMGLVDPTSNVARRTLTRMEELWNQEWDSGGYALHNVSSEPTKLGSWWMSFYMITQASVELEDWPVVERNLEWLARTPDGVGGMWWEYRDADERYQIDHGVIPWLAFGEAVSLLIRHILGFRPQSDRILIRPRLLPSQDRVDGRLRVGSAAIHLVVRREDVIAPMALVGGRTATVDRDGTLAVPVPSDDISIEYVLPSEIAKKVGNN